MLAIVSGCSARCQINSGECIDALFDCKFSQVVDNLCSAGEPFPCASSVECCEIVESEPVEDVGVGCEVSEITEIEETVEVEKEVEVCEPALALNAFYAFDHAIDLKRRIAVGPPAVRYRPQMPPKFLAVPTGPICTGVSAGAPSVEHNPVEVDFGPQLALPGRN